MTEAIGIAASIVQIAGFGLNAARSLNQLRRSIGSQAANLERLEAYVESTSDLLQQVKRHVEGDDHLGTYLDVNLRRDIRTTLRSCELVFLEIEKLAQRARAQREGPAAFLHSIRYATFSEYEVKELRNELVQCKSTLICFLNIYWANSAQATRNAIDALLDNLQSRDIGTPSDLREILTIERGASQTEQSRTLSEADTLVQQAATPQISLDRSILRVSTHNPNESNPSSSNSLELLSVKRPTMWSGRPQSKRLKIQQIHAGKQIIHAFLKDGAKVVLQRLAELDSKTEKAIREHVQQQQECLLALQIHYRRAILRQLLYGKVASLQFVSGDAEYILSRTPQSAAPNEAPKIIPYKRQPSPDIEVDPSPSSEGAFVKADDIARGTLQTPIVQSSPASLGSTTMVSSRSTVDSKKVTGRWMEFGPDELPSHSYSASTHLLSNTQSYVSMLFRPAFWMKRWRIHPRAWARRASSITSGIQTNVRKSVASDLEALNYEGEANALVAELRRRWNLRERNEDIADKEAQTGDVKDD